MGAPEPGNDYVRRPAVVGRLIAARDASLALIVAPAGYGKSTLLADWAAQDERPFIWVTLTRSERDAASLAARIVAALREAGGLDAPAGRTRSLRGDDAPAALLQATIDLLKRSGQGFVLVLDDVHTVPRGALRALGTALLDRPPPGVQIAMASRVEPPLPIGRLRGHRRLVEVRSEDLAMVPAEAAALLRMAGLELDFRGVQALSSQTEGWAVGLYLAALSLRGEEDQATAVTAFAGDNRLVAEYLRDEVLGGLSPTLRRFLIHSSVLDELTGPACDAVLEQSGSSVTLSRLRRGQPMLVSLDQTERRFRCHGLFRGMLRAELRRTNPELEPRLHERASRWLHQHEDVEGALAHAVAASNLERSGELLWERIPHYLGHGDTETVQRWLTAFTSTQLAGNATLSLVAGLTCLATGSGEQARHWAALAAEAQHRAPDPGAESRLPTGLAIIDAATSRDRAPAMGAAAAEAYEREGAHSAWRPICCLVSGVAEQLAGHEQSAWQRLEEGAGCAVERAPLIAVLCLAQLALLAIDGDNWPTAAELAEQAVSMAGPPHLDRDPLSALAFATAAATRATQGRADEAKRDMRHAADLLAEFGDSIAWYAAETRLMLARAAIRLADTVTARTLLAETSRLARRTPHAATFRRWLDEAWAQIDSVAEGALAGSSSLTIAELRILRFLPSHRSFREIAELLGVSVNTVKTQAHAVYRKLDAASRSEAVARASQAGLLGI